MWRIHDEGGSDGGTFASCGILGCPADVRMPIVVYARGA